ncbi:4'-phosphopantetheinyl transferase superfamily protein [Streptomyces sp. NPDC051322]|uniref:4'-phosphopantetheinyl transferase family protein n=1 Tax=Streptomyces sp. NPDC051322 TaxID=3154645 RepID=UPI00344F83B3
MTPLAKCGPVLAGVLAPLLPTGVAVVDTFYDSNELGLFPEEEALLVKAVQKRRQEFSTGRRCARAALAAHGLPPAPILPGPRGAPLWPDGMVGSITHCAGYRAAAVARATDIAALGIDAEPTEPLRDPGVLALLTDAEERAALAGLKLRQPETPWEKLLFSAKESVYKAWFPLTGEWLGFHDAHVSLAPDGTFTATLLVPGPSVGGIPLTGFDGRWLVTGGLAVTAVTLSATAVRDRTADGVPR